jgi:hypothetical protein
MANICTICSQSEEIQEKIIQWHKEQMESNLTIFENKRGSLP